MEFSQYNLITVAIVENTTCLFCSFAMHLTSLPCKLERKALFRGSVIEMHFKKISATQKCWYVCTRKIKFLLLVYSDISNF